MKKIFNTIFAVLAGAAVVSCNLDVLPTSAIAITEGEALIQTEENLEQFTLNLHGYYRACHQGEYYIAEEVMLDNFNATSGYGNNYGTMHKCDGGLTANDYYISDFWQVHYGCINADNVYLENTVTLPEELQEAGNIGRGYAYFYRAAAYLALARHFCAAYDETTAGDPDTGLLLILKQDITAKPARATLKETYEQIGKDLNEAEKLLAGVAGSIRAEVPTIDAVHALKVRYFLDLARGVAPTTEVNYTDSVAFYGNAVINSAAGYALANTAAQMQKEFRTDDGNEPIMQMYGSTSELPGGMGAFTGASEDSEAGIYYAPLYLPSKALIDRYETTDLRYKMWFDNTLQVRSSGTYYTGVTLFVRYLGNPALYNTNYPQSYQKVRPFTLPEIYLSMAEAYTAAGDATNAVAALNALQTARGTTTTSADETNVFREWQREMVGQGQLMSAFKRFGLGYNGRAGQEFAVSNAMLTDVGDVFTRKKLDASDYHWVWAIPTHEIKINPNIKQNPEWADAAATDEQTEEGEA